MLRDQRFSVEPQKASNYRDVRALSEKTEYVQRLTEQLMLFRDPPDHTRLRNLVQKAFTPRVIQSFRESTARLASELIDVVVANGSMEILADFAWPLPVIVIAEMLGVPVEQRQRFRDWARDLALTLEPVIPPGVGERADRSARALSDFLSDLIAERAARPRNDLVTALAQAEHDGDRLSHDELLANLMLLLIAGHETTMNLIGNGMLALLRHPDQQELLTRNPSLAPGAVEELIRFDGPVHATQRIPTEPVTVGDQKIAAGDRVIVIIAAANRDPAWFVEPDRLDLARANNRHLGFGGGPHYCLGNALARLEAEIAFPLLLRRLRGLALDGPEPEYRDTVALRGLKALTVSFEPGA